MAQLEMNAAVDAKGQRPNAKSIWCVAEGSGDRHVYGTDDGERAADAAVREDREPVRAPRRQPRDADVVAAAREMRAEDAADVGTRRAVRGGADERRRAAQIRIRPDVNRVHAGPRQRSAIDRPSPEVERLRVR